ncbi:MAG: transporter [Candidatus Poribacteria bacterium]|nr:transporter [Candidatus Poribacteria bacterium]
MQKQQSDWSRDLILLAIAIFFLGFGFNGLFNTVYTNFIADDIHVQPHQLGVLESIRESPGFLSAFIAALTMAIPSPILGFITLIIMAFGIGSFSQIHTVPALVFWAVFWSLGFHCWAPLQPAMVLSLTKDAGKGRRLGQISRINSIASLLGMGLIYFLGKTQSIIRPMFLVAGISIAIAAVLVLLVSRKTDPGTKMPRLIMKKQYRYYYALTFLEGCRKQVFITFAIFVMIRVFETPVNRIALLMVINGILGLIFAPIIGRIVDRIGERISLSMSNLSLIGVFIGYALVKNVHALYVLYCLDSFIYMFNVAQTTYLNKIALPEDVRPALSMGTTMNHAAAVTVPLIGGLLWEALDRYDIIFYGGSVVVFIAFVVVQFLWSDGKK